MNVSRLYCSVAALACVASYAQAGPAVARAPVTGLVAERPASGGFEETDRGFMVEYAATIPGTEVPFTMVPVPGGTYTMNRHGNTFIVEIEPFWMGKTEVTWAEYQEYMSLTTALAKFDDRGWRQVSEANALDAITAPSKLYEPSFTFESGDDPDQPAVSMTQYSAKQYTKWLRLISNQFYRLPSEAEWEYACSAGSGGRFSFGDDPARLGDYAWYSENADHHLGSVATKKSNTWKLHDMHGNAAERVLDAYEPTDGAPGDGCTVTKEQAIAWPDLLYPRTLKGGGWQQQADQCTTRSRLASDDEWRMKDPNSPQSPWWYASDEGQQVGFRLLRPLADASPAGKEEYWEADIRRILAHVNRRIDEEGRGERGLADPNLPNAIETLE